MNQQNKYPVAALTVLVVLQLTMLAALFTETTPHPPASIPLFGMAPYLGASIAIAIAAIILGPTQTMAGQILSAITLLLALITFGPQKWFDPTIGLIWPAVLLGQICIITIALSLFSSLRSAAATGMGPENA